MNKGHIWGMEAVSWLENKASVYRIMEDKKKTERFWGLTIQFEKLELNFLGNGKAFQFLRGEIMF